MSPFHKNFSLAGRSIFEIISFITEESREYTYTPDDVSAGDVDGDGKAELICKTATGTIDGQEERHQRRRHEHLRRGMAPYSVCARHVSRLHGNLRRR